MTISTDIDKRIYGFIRYDCIYSIGGANELAVGFDEPTEGRRTSPVGGIFYIGDAVTWKKLDRI
jgi:hypothetical protein